MKISTINYIREQNKDDAERAVEQFTADWRDQQFIKFLEDRMGDEISVIRRW